MLKSHYEKIILSVSFATAVVFVLLLFLSGDDRKPFAESTSIDAFYFDTTESGIQTLELSKETALLPGDSITFVSIGDEQEPRKFQISKIILKNRSSLTVGFNDREIEGRLMSGDDVTLDRGWKKSRTPLEIASKQGRASIPLNEVSYILGERLYVLGEEIDELYSEEWNISLHQAFAEKKDDENETKTERVRWTKTDDDTGDSIYDLFTPPIIYLIDGNLTTSLPEKVEVLEEKTEEFGLSLQSFDKKAYRFRMRGFTNKFPFFEDLDLRVKENRLNPRTRMELNIAYQDNLSGNPGSSSLVKAINEENKLIEVNTTLKFEDKQSSEKKSYYEIVYATIIKIDDDVKEKKELEKIILCDLPTKIYPNLESSFLNLVHDSGHAGIKLEKKIDFNKLYKDRFN